MNRLAIFLYSAILSALAVSAAEVRAAITDNLIGLYEFDGNFLDTSGAGNFNHGVGVNGPGFAPGKIGTAMTLTGLQDYMSLDPTILSDLDFGDTNNATDVDFTMAMWIRQDDFLSDPAVLSNKNWNNGDNTGINWAPKGNGIFDLNTKGTTGARRDLDIVGNSFPLTVGQWNLVVMSVDRDGATELYINGNNTGTIPVTSTGSFNGGLPWNIGQDGTGSYSVEFTGAVDELAIWRRAITPAEAGQLWNGGSGIELGSQVVESGLKLVIDRDSGAMSIENNTGSNQNLIGYQITSATGALSQTGWTPVSGRLDGAGDQSIDTDNWLVVTQNGAVGDLSEVSLGTGVLDDGSQIELGPGTWAKFYEETTDIRFQYADGAGSSLIEGLVAFTGGANEPAPFDFGDLDFDGDLDADDWEQLQSEFGSPLTSKSEAERYRLSDLNNDGIHTLDDILEFQIAYDNANGLGSFQALITAVPEPTTALLLVAATCGVLAGANRRRGFFVLFLFGLSVAGGRESLAASLYTEDFDSVSLGAPVDETAPGTNVWTSTPPVGWTVDNTNLPSGGVTEWRGWSFADPAWWASVDDQNRSQFTKASGALAVVDPDEWDDLPRDPGFYESYLETPSIPLLGSAEDTVQLRFDSSWRPEDTQTANVTVSFDAGPEIELFRWTSVPGDSDFKADATNETVVVPVNNPAGATNMTLNFGMFDAGNDWWWAIDNIEVFSPLTLEVDVQSGQMQILGDSTVALKGYEVHSPGNSLDPVNWVSGNLDAQNVGNSVLEDADFNSSGLVDSVDLGIWETAYGTTVAGDADGDGLSTGLDFLDWQSHIGSTGVPASTWLTFLATDERLIESYLFDSSTFVSNQPVGQGYDTLQDVRDLVFTYTTDTNEKLSGVVKYVNLPASVSTVPEPSGAALLLIGSGILCVRKRRELTANH